MTQRTEHFEYCLLFDALQRHRGRLKEVQLELQVSRKTLYDKLKNISWTNRSLRLSSNTSKSLQPFSKNGLKPDE